MLSAKGPFTFRLGGFYKGLNLFWEIWVNLEDALRMTFKLLAHFGSIVFPRV